MNASLEPERAKIVTAAGEKGWLNLADIGYRFVQKPPLQLDTAQAVIRSVLREGPLPTDPDDPTWAEATPLDVLLSGQVIARPRIQTPTVDRMTVRSFYNEETIVFLLEWNDRFKNKIHEAKEDYPPSDSYPTTYLQLWGDGGTMTVEKKELLRDSVAIQFPEKPTEGPQKPHFFLGDRSNPVNLWRWDSEKGEEGEASEWNATGFQSAPAAQPAEGQSVRGRGRFHNGRWRVVISRSLRTDDPEDVQILPGQLQPISFAAWDGWNGEKGLICSLSSWYYLLPVVPTPARAYLIGLGAILAAAIVELLLVRSRKSRI